MTRFLTMLLVVATTQLVAGPVHAADRTIAICVRGAACGKRVPQVIGGGGGPKPAVLQVCTAGCPYSSIQAAIEAAKTGDIVDVAKGTYKETLSITPPVAAMKLTLRGADPVETVVDAEKKDVVLEVEAGYEVSASGMRFTNGRGIGAGGILNHGILSLREVLVTDNEGLEGAGGVGNDEGATLTITGAGINGNTASNAFSGQGGGVLNFGKATLTGVVLTFNTAMAFAGGIRNGGVMDLTGVDLARNTTPGLGGGIENHSLGILTVRDSHIRLNSAFTGGGIFNNGSLTVTSTEITENDAAEGGGLENSVTGTAVLTASPITGNHADAEGGAGLFNDQGTLTVIDSPITGNRAQPTNGGPTRGGGLSVSYGAVTLRNSPISGNSAIGSIAVGGGVSIAAGTLSLIQSPVSSNSASTEGGGIYSFDGDVALDASPVQNNAPDDCVNVPGC